MVFISKKGEVHCLMYFLLFETLYKGKLTIDFMAAEFAYSSTQREYGIVLFHIQGLDGVGIINVFNALGIFDMYQDVAGFGISVYIGVDVDLYLPDHGFRYRNKQESF